MKLADLKVKLFADGADLAGIREVASNPLIKGFTTNPTLMRKAGVEDYERFAKAAIELIGDRPISFEVFADDWDEMRAQALEISSWASNIYVKIPVTDTSGRSAAPLLRDLASRGVKLNVTALLALEQVGEVANAIAEAPSGIVSVFAGRYADTGRDPVPMMTKAVEVLRPYRGLELLWASPRELLNIFHAEAAGCHIITATNDVLAKLPLVGKDPLEYSLDTVRMFFDDARKAAYRIRTAERPPTRRD
ncbi:MAG TPA: transaldolase [Candidatus Limnocylindria bacterium]|nr:transaldolase [Candidatus Limnocylindria bacterium]